MCRTIAIAMVSLVFEHCGYVAGERFIVTPATAPLGTAKHCFDAQFGGSRSLACPALQLLRGNRLRPRRSPFPVKHDISLVADTPPAGMKLEGLFSRSP